MQIDPKKQTKKENYKLLIGAIVPRPIAFVTTHNKEGVVNAAPFSFFNAVASDPPMICIASGRKARGLRKDTASNILEMKEFVVHVVDGDNVEGVNTTAIEFPSHMSEVEEVGFHLTPSAVVDVPRIKETKVQMECILHQMIPLGGTEKEPNTDLIIGEVVHIHVADDLYEEGRINTLQLNPVGRLAGTTYCKVGETFSMTRPSYEDWLCERN